MSILIKGMDMPKNCRTCKLIDYDRGCYRCIVTTTPCDLNSKNENCPLVSIPPHGALMDRDDFFAACPELVDGYKQITDDFVVIEEEEGE